MFDATSAHGPLARRTTVVGAVVAVTLWPASVTYLWINELHLVYRRTRVVPVRAARALFRQFPGRKALLELSGGHSDVGFGDDESLVHALAHFWPSPER